MMTEDARKRIQALEQYSELGSGFNIAMKDLEIRGAGDLLGGEQSGFINEIGFETYQKIMNEAIEELKKLDFIDSEEYLHQAQKAGKSILCVSNHSIFCSLIVTSLFSEDVEESISVGISNDLR